MDHLRIRSNKTGVPYQRLLNQILKEALKAEGTMETRLEKLEKELDKLKKSRLASDYAICRPRSLAHNVKEIPFRSELFCG